MSEIKENDITPKYIPNATTITNKSLKSFPNVKHFFEILVENVDVVAKHVGRSFQYPLSVERGRYFSAYGLFMDYFIRKHLSNQYNTEITDTRTEYILDNPDDFIVGRCVTLRDAIKKNYEIFKDSNTRAIDIVKSIQIVSLSHIIFFHESIPREVLTINEENLREVIRYLERLPYKSVDLNPILSCNYFNADADLIFDNDVIYEIKTSKFKSLTYDEEEIPMSKFYQTIIYGFGLYKNTGIKVKKFKIYNPLLGDEFLIELNNINFELFEKALQRDVAAFCRLQKILNEEMILDLSLFSEENKEDQI